MAVTLTNADSHLYCVGNNLPNTVNPFTLNVWINAVWNGGGRLSFLGLYDGVPATGTATTGAGLQIGTSFGSGQVTCWVYGGTTMVEGTGMTAFNNTWVMLTYVYGGGTHSIYRNGVLLASATTAFTAAQMTQVYINGYPPTGNAGECAAFSVDSYSAWNRALSANEIITLFSNQGARGGNMTSIGCRYELDEGTLGTAVTAGIDITGRGQTLLHTGATNTTTYTYSGVANSNTRPVQ